jgi:hypothetical protein
MRKTRWVVFTRMNAKENPRTAPYDPSEREWSVRVTPAERSPFMDGGRRDLTPVSEPDRDRTPSSR